MTKLSDTLRAALAKKKGQTHPENDSAPAVEKKVKTAQPVASKKPPAKSAGRGR